MKAIHWIMSIGGALIVGLQALASSEPQLAQTLHVVCALLTTLLTIAASLSPSASVAVNVKAVKDSMRPPPLDDAGARGFATVHALFAISLAGLLACGTLFAVTPPAAVLGVCVAKYVKENPGLSFTAYVVQAAKVCQSSIAAVLEALVTSTDPALGQYKAEALATRQDPVKLGALRAAAGEDAGAP